MFLLSLSVVVVAFLVLLFLFTQVLRPLYKGTPLFPSFSKDELNSQLTETARQLEEQDVRDKLRDMTEELNSRKAQTKE